MHGSELAGIGFSGAPCPVARNHRTRSPLVPAIGVIQGLSMHYPGWPSDCHGHRFYPPLWIEANHGVSRYVPIRLLYVTPFPHPIGDKCLHVQLEHLFSIFLYANQVFQLNTNPPETRKTARPCRHLTYVDLCAEVFPTIEQRCFPPRQYRQTPRFSIEMAQLRRVQSWETGVRERHAYTPSERSIMRGM